MGFQKDDFSITKKRLPKQSFFCAEILPAVTVLEDTVRDFSFFQFGEGFV